MGTWETQQSPEPWRERLRPASFRGAKFHVEVGGKQSGRRIALHEYPKRDQPFAEDMGKRTIMFEITGYCVEWDRQLGRDYTQPRDALIAALDKEGPGTLIHPTLKDDLQFVCERYSISESRDKGGYCVFQMHFIEAGQAAGSIPYPNTTAAVSSAAANANAASSQSFAANMPGGK